MFNYYMTVVFWLMEKICIDAKGGLLCKLPCGVSINQI
jgi:hypothetical protein